MTKLKFHNKRLIAYNGKEYEADDLLLLEEAAVGLGKKLLFKRLKTMDVHTALTTPLNSVVEGKCGCRVRYGDKVYVSMVQACSELGIKYRFFTSVLVKKKYRINEAIDYCLNKKRTLTYLYKGEYYSVNELVVHPENIHLLTYGAIKARIKSGKHSDDTLLALPPSMILRKTKMVYRGVEYESLTELCRINGITEYHPNLVSQRTKENRERYLDKLLSHINVKELK